MTGKLIYQQQWVVWTGATSSLSILFESGLLENIELSPVNVMEIIMALWNYQAFPRMRFAVKCP